MVKRIAEKSFGNPFIAKNEGGRKISGASFIRMTDHLPSYNHSTGEVVVERSVGKTGLGAGRASSHWTINEPVEAHLWASWDHLPIVIIAPAADMVERNGYPASFAGQDTWWYRDMALPKETVVLIDQVLLEDLSDIQDPLHRESLNRLKRQLPQFLAHIPNGITVEFYKDAEDRAKKLTAFRRKHSVNEENTFSMASHASGKTNPSSYVDSKAHEGYHDMTLNDAIFDFKMRAMLVSALLDIDKDHHTTMQQFMDDEKIGEYFVRFASSAFGLMNQPFDDRKVALLHLDSETIRVALESEEFDGWGEKPAKRTGFLERLGYGLVFDKQGMRDGTEWNSAHGQQVRYACREMFQSVMPDLNTRIAEVNRKLGKSSYCADPIPLLSLDRFFGGDIPNKPPGMDIKANGHGRRMDSHTPHKSWTPEDYARAFAEGDRFTL